MLFYSERLSFRPWEVHDRPALARLLTCAQTMHHWPAPLDDAAVSRWLARNVDHYHTHGYSRFCCSLRSDEQVVGDVGVVNLMVRDQPVVDLGYIIHVDHWRTGLGFEAAQAVVNWLLPQAEQLGIKKLVATMATDNLGSVAVARKLGMHLIETFHNPNNLNKETCYFEYDLERPSS